MAKKFFKIRKKELYDRLEQLQESERVLKGDINNALYIYVYNEDEDLIQKLFWKRQTWSAIAGFLGKAVRKANINKITVSNEFHDWEIVLFSRK